MKHIKPGHQVNIQRQFFALGCIEKFHIECQYTQFRELPVQGLCSGKVPEIGAAQGPFSGQILFFISEAAGKIFNTLQGPFSRVSPAASLEISARIFSRRIRLIMAQVSVKHRVEMKCAPSREIFCKALSLVCYHCSRERKPWGSKALESLLAPFLLHYSQFIYPSLVTHNAFFPRLGLTDALNRYILCNIWTERRDFYAYCKTIYERAKPGCAASQVLIPLIFVG